LSSFRKDRFREDWSPHLGIARFLTLFIMKHVATIACRGPALLYTAFFDPAG
jgi:hypothetical protein